MNNRKRRNKLARCEQQEVYENGFWAALRTKTMAKWMRSWRGGALKKNPYCRARK